MSADWIKIRTELYRDPKVSVMADILSATDSPLSRYVARNGKRDMSVSRNVIRNAVVGALVSVWGVMRHQGHRSGDDLLVIDTNISAIDDAADLAGFGDAMLSCGWLVDDGLSLVFPKFFESNNVEPNADSRAKNRERQRRYRDKKRNDSRNATVTSQRNAREEKRREETKESKPKKTEDANKVISSYQRHHPKSRPGDSIRKKILARLAEGFTVEDLLLAIEGCHKSPFHCGDNKDSRKFQGLELIMRDSEHVTQFVELSGEKGRNGDPSMRAAVAAWDAWTKLGKTDPVTDRITSQLSCEPHSPEFYVQGRAQFLREYREATNGQVCDNG